MTTQLSQRLTSRKLIAFLKLIPSLAGGFAAGFIAILLVRYLAVVFFEPIEMNLGIAFDATVIAYVLGTFTAGFATTFLCAKWNAEPKNIYLMFSVLAGIAIIGSGEWKIMSFGESMPFYFMFCASFMHVLFSFTGSYLAKRTTHA